MDQSLDSIGSCSLDADVSRDYSEHFESSNESQVGAVSLADRNQKLFAEDSVKPPSYVHLSCSISGYTGINNYNSKLRESHNFSLPSEMASNNVPVDSVDACIQMTQTSTATTTTTVIKSDNRENVEKKSFVQQRIERLYGPGVLLQEFHQFKKRSSMSPFTSPSVRKNISVPNTPINNNNSCISMSPPTLPVFRHLSPEFRSQLQINKDRRPRNALFQKDDNIIENCRISNGDSVATKPKEVKDGYFYLDLVESEIKRIFDTADKYEVFMNDPEIRNLMSEEVAGFLRSAVGKAKLLTSQKLKQFQGLCLKCVNTTDDDPFPTTIQDLQGFWDMVSIQVTEVNSVFERLEQIKNNNWIDTSNQENISNNKNAANNEIVSNGSKTPKKPVVVKKPVSAADEEQRKEREVARKKLLEEKRKEMRNLRKKQSTNQSDIIEIFVPES